MSCRVVPSRVRSTIPSVPLVLSTRWPRSSPHPLPARPHWTSPPYTRGSECLRGIPCRRADRNGSSFTNTPEAQALPSIGITRLHRYLWPFPTPGWSAALSGDVHGSRRRDLPGPPPLTPDYLSDMLCSLPRWTDSVRYGSCDGALPRRVLPDSFRLPRSCDGSASTLPLSRPAQALHALRPARLLAHHTWTLSRGFDPPRFQGWPPASYRI